jgi:peptidylprolyl isomerase
MSVAATASFAQTTPAPKTPAKSSTTTKPAVHTGVATAGPKLPPGVPPARGLMKTAFALRYQDIKIGEGPLAEPNKLYHVHYTGWLASDGTKFDSSYDHVTPVMDKDGKPESDEDGKPKMTKPEPLTFPQGFGRLIPGWDQGFEGMHVGGKRRLFIPYQLAYGAAGRPPKIPVKSDLIFDVELVEVTDLPANMPRPGQPRPGMPPPGGMRMNPGAPGAPPAPGTAPAAPPAVPAPAKPADPTNPTTTPTPAPSTPPPPAPAPPTAPADKPANPAQPN